MPAGLVVPEPKDTFELQLYQLTKRMRSPYKWMMRQKLMLNI